MSPMTSDRWAAPATSFVWYSISSIVTDKRIGLTLHDHAERIPDQNGVDPRLFDDACEQRVVRRHDDDLPSCRACTSATPGSVITRVPLS